MEEDGLMTHATEVGQYLKSQLQTHLGSLPGVLEVRGQGLLIGVELNQPCGALIGLAAEAGLLLSVTSQTNMCCPCTAIWVYLQGAIFRYRGCLSNGRAKMAALPKAATALFILAQTTTIL